jgi:hypothetical protein
MFDTEYTATWDGHYLSIVAVLLVSGDEKLRSSEILKATACKTEAQVLRLLKKQGFRTDEVVRNERFSVVPVTRIERGHKP